MTPKTQVMIGNWAGGLALLSFLLGLAAEAIRVLPPGISFAMCAPLFMVGVATRMALDSRHDRIRIAPHGEIRINGTVTTLDGVLGDLPIDDPYLKIETIESRIERAGNNLYRTGPTAFLAQIRWFVWVEREYDPQRVPEVAVELIALLKKHDVPFSCTWVRPRLVRPSANHPSGADR